MVHKVVPCSLIASFTLKCLAAGRQTTRTSQKTVRLLLPRSFGMQRRHLVYDARAAREATSLRHPLHCRSGNNGTSGGNHRLHQVGNSLCLPHHSQYKNINGPQTRPQASCGRIDFGGFCLPGEAPFFLHSRLFARCFNQPRALHE